MLVILGKAGEESPAESRQKETALGVWLKKEGPQPLLPILFLHEDLFSIFPVLLNSSSLTLENMQDL